MKKLTIGLILAMALVAITGVAALVADVTSADGERPAQGNRAAARDSFDGSSPRNDRSHLRGNAHGPEDAEAVVRPFIGIAIRALGDEEAEELGIDGGVVVLRVEEDSPADGLLMPDDVITEVAGEAVSTPSEVVNAVRDSEPGDTLTFTVIRDGDTMDVDVTVGEREVARFRHFPAPFPGPNGLGGPWLGGILGNIRGMVDAEVTVETDDGLKTIHAVVGTVTEVDVDEGTFVLDPADGSDTVEYTIDDETVVQIRHRGDLSGLNTEDKTLVVTVTDDDGTRVMLVRQGAPIGRGRGHGFLGAGPGLGFHAPPEGLEGFRGRLHELRGRIQGLLPDDDEDRVFLFQQLEGLGLEDLEDFSEDFDIDDILNVMSQ